jgi:iron complex transport system substrate-binding protein
LAESFQSPGVSRGDWRAILLTAIFLASAAHAGKAPPAQRIISLAPHLTELAFAAGAGDRLVGVAEFSDFPAGAESLPRVGDAFRVDLERIVVLEPDLILAWGTGNRTAALERLAAMGVRLEILEPGGLEDIAVQIRRIGVLAGTSAAAEASARAFEAGLAVLRSEAAQAPALRVFVQMSVMPIYTVTGRHVLNDLVETCGGENVFRDASGVAPPVSVEAVLAARPEVILASVDPELLGTPQGAQALDRWRPWSDLPATRAGQLHLLDADLVSRATPRLLEGGRKMCEILRRAAPGGG